MSYPYGYVPQAWMSQRPDMAQGHPQTNQIPQAAAQNPMSVFACRPVTSRLEAEAVQVDFIGPGTLMPDLSHGMIYLKRFNSNTGVSDFLEFAFQRPQEPPAPVQYATLDDLKALRMEIEQLFPKGGDEV